MHIKRIIHIGVAVDSVKHAKRLFHQVLGLPIGGEEIYEGDIDICFLPVGDSSIELIADNPKTGTGKVKSFLEETGSEGIHHIALEVDNIESAVNELKGQGIPMIDEQPKPGAHGTRIAFINPSATHGVLIELVEV
jgi:methylmalonyl-CoA epimerase